MKFYLAFFLGALIGIIGFVIVAMATQGSLVQLVGVVLMTLALPVGAAGSSPAPKRAAH